MKVNNIDTKSKQKFLMFFIAALLIVCMVLAYFFSKEDKDLNPIQKTDFALDTFVTVILYDRKGEKLLDEALELCNSYELVFSATRNDSELYKLNHRNEDEKQIEVSEDLAYVIKKALYYSDVSDGAFDISIEPVKRLWNFKSEDPVLPRDEDIKRELSKVDYKKISISGNIVSFEDKDTMIDLGAIAKGYIADKIKEFLESKKVKSAIINLGGNVLCIGKKPGGKDFIVGLQKPYASHSETIEALRINDLSVVSSGIYERYIEVDGKSYHHILNPKTGYPYDTGIISVSIVCPKSCDADALSTTCFSLGVDKSLKLIDSIPDTYAYFIMDDYSIIYSEGARNLIKAGE